MSTPESVGTSSSVIDLQRTTGNDPKNPLYSLLP